jgi:hypothetical protein
VLTDGHRKRGRAFIGDEAELVHHLCTPAKCAAFYHHCGYR